MPTLHWLTREKDLAASAQAPYRLLEAVETYGDDPHTENMLIQGDNLDGLKALLPFYAGKVKCVYVDPPFNTGQAFEHYDDNIEHSIWLGMMYARFELIRDLLSVSGTLVVHLDDEELAYCTIILDEIFGRVNRINLCTFRQGAAVGHKSINPGVVTVTNYLLIYAKDKLSSWVPNKVYTKRDRDKRYSSYIENYDANYKDWKLIPLSQALAKELGIKKSNLKKELGDNYEEVTNNFVMKNAHRVVQSVSPAYNSVGQGTRNIIDLSKQHPETLFLQSREGYSDIYLKDGKRWLFYKSKLKEIDGELVSGEPLTNLWDDLLSNNLHNEGGVKFPKGKKPESLIQRVLSLFTEPGEVVLDSFLGSGTTAAVAHKMNRKYIGIENGEHAASLCIPRLQRVIEGEQGVQR